MSEPRLDGDAIYWLEARPREAGRVAIVRRGPDGQATDVISEPFSARTKVHEYGGGAYMVDDGVVYFANFADQQLYLVRPGGHPERITAENDARYADAIVDRRRRRLICVRETHLPNHEARNEIVAVRLDGSGSVSVLVTGNDFYSSPRLSHDGTRLAWLTWNHPEMPWTSSELWETQLDAAGTPVRHTRVAGGPGESVFQPEWSPDDVLYFVADRTGWWNLYRRNSLAIEPVAPQHAEFGRPQWVFGMSTYAFESADTVVCASVAMGVWKLAVLDTRTLRLTPIDLPYEDIADVRARPGAAIFRAGSPTDVPAIITLDLRSLATEVPKASAAGHPALEPYFSAPTSREFATTSGTSTYAFYYPPKNPGFVAPKDERPPLIVKCHGGPTAAATSTLDLSVQYWTSRGFAVAAVNYGGSSGYGREYRERLRENWGIVDLDDCVNVAEGLARQGLVDRTKMLISGGSAGGFTTLCALTFRTNFSAGASYYGIGDLEALARDTHKFESHYLDGLIGRWPAEAQRYRDRSPIHSVHELRVPVILFQGEDDRVVPPSQAEQIESALRAAGVPFASVLFAGEGHGFRRAGTIKRALDAELAFYAVHVLRQRLRV